MSNELNRRSPLSNGTVVASLVAAVACVWASDAPANGSATEPSAAGKELSARIAAIVERVRLVDPALARDLPADKKIVQFRN
jgi:hypothetical protein